MGMAASPPPYAPGSSGPVKVHHVIHVEWDDQRKAYKCIPDVWHSDTRIQSVIGHRSAAALLVLAPLHSCSIPSPPTCRTWTG